jgi:hypothetical protein
MILQPDRAARLVAQQAVDGSLPGLADVLTALEKAVFGAAAANAYETAIAQAVQRVLVERLMVLAGNAPMPQVRAVASLRLQAVQAALPTNVSDDNTRAHARLLDADIKRFLDRPLEPARPAAAPQMPPGAPIGDPDLQWLDVPTLMCPDAEGREGRGFYPPLFVTQK